MNHLLQFGSFKYRFFDFYFIFDNNAPPHYFNVILGLPLACFSSFILNHSFASVYF